MLSIHADVRLEIDGRAATLTGSGRRLTLELENARMARTLFDVELPRHGGVLESPRDVPGMLADRGLSVEIRDARGPLLVVGADAQGSSVSLPFFGTIEHVSIAGAGAVRRLAIGR